MSTRLQRTSTHYHTMAQAWAHQYALANSYGYDSDNQELQSQYLTLMLKNLLSIELYVRFLSRLLEKLRCVV